MAYLRGKIEVSRASPAGIKTNISANAKVILESDRHTTHKIYRKKFEAIFFTDAD